MTRCLCPACGLPLWEDARQDAAVAVASGCILFEPVDERDEIGGES